MIVAIDGPAGSGKSTIARIIAEKLGFVYLDTGAMYRALTLKTIMEGIENTDEKNVIRLAESLDFNFNENSRVFLDGKDVTEEIRTPQIVRAISPICKIPAVREALVFLQRKIAGRQDIVTEGRDTTTVVFPGAELKVFLIASVEERAKRRLNDFKAKGIEITLDAVKDDIEKRDHADYSRDAGPLKKAEDAYELDTTGLTIEQVVDKILGRLGDGTTISLR